MTGPVAGKVSRGGLPFSGGCGGQSPAESCLDLDGVAPVPLHQASRLRRLGHRALPQQRAQQAGKRAGKCRGACLPRPIRVDSTIVATWVAVRLWLHGHGLLARQARLQLRCTGGRRAVGVEPRGLGTRKRRLVPTLSAAIWYKILEMCKKVGDTKASSARIPRTDDQVNPRRVRLFGAFGTSEADT